MSKPDYIKTNRAFSNIRKTAWMLTLVVAIGGQFFPPLGLIVPFIMISLIVMSFFKGRYWCGNYCPHGSFFDILIMPITRNTKIPMIFRSQIFIVLFFLFFMVQFSRRIIDVFVNLGEISLVNSLGIIFSSTYLIVLLAGGILGVIFNARTWCYFCPMGTMQTIFYKLGSAAGATASYDEKVTITHPKLCRSCGKCAKVCPMQLNPHHSFKDDNNQLNEEKCIRCFTCVNNCPVGELQLVNADKAASLKENAEIK